MRLAEIMKHEVITVGPEDTIEHARTLLSRHRIRHLPVLDGHSVIGVVSDRDLQLASLAEMEEDDERFASQPIERVMTAPAVTLGPNDTVREAANIMRGRKLDCIPVVEKHRIVGIVTSSDLLELLSRTPKASHPRPHTANDPRRPEHQHERTPSALRMKP